MAAPFEASPSSLPNANHERVLKNIVDVTSLMILQATSAAPRTVRDLAVELNLPIATLYRRVRSLQSVGAILGHKVKDGTTGKETMVYESAVQGLRINFGMQEPVFHVDLRDDGEDPADPLDNNGAAPPPL